MLFVENDKAIICSDKSKIKEELKVLKNSKYGANSKVYIYNANELLKVFKTPHSVNELLELEELKQQNIPTLVTPNKYLNINGQFFGYSMNKVKGRMLFYIDDLNIRKLLLALLKIEKDLILLAKKGFIADDLNPGNILYSSKTQEINLIDCESYTKSNWYKEKNAFVNLNELYMMILNVITSKNIYGNYNNEFFNFMRKMIFNQIDYNKINVYDYFNSFITTLEDYNDNEIVSVKDFKKTLALFNE